MGKLKEFMEGRPHSKNVPLEDAVIEYVEQVEQASIKRANKLKKEN